MGIPRLTSHLEAFLKNAVIGCTNRDCTSNDTDTPSNAIIDGPGFAYFIYYKIPGRNGAASAIEAQPSYSELGGAVLACLRFLESCGLNVKHIFFDGGLPESKRETRLQRLNDTLLKLSTYRTVHGNGFKVGTAKEVVLRPADLLHLWSVPLFAKNLPASPFLVSAAFEALRDSEFADRTQLVPGEADGYLATVTRDSASNLCLTGDSDMAIHRLGEGSMAFLTSLDAQPCSKCEGGYTLLARTLSQSDLIEKIGEEASWDDLVDLAYEIKQNPSTGFEEALRRIRAKTSNAHKSRALGWSESLHAFANEYRQAVDMSALSQRPSWLRTLDSRTSEIAVQLELDSASPPSGYLLPLIEDPTRVSAWVASRGIRQIAYTILLQRLNSTASHVTEVTRSGQRITEIAVEILASEDLDASMQIVQHRILQIKQRLPEQSFCHASAWIIFAMTNIVETYLLDDRPAPTPEMIKSALGSTKSGKLSWSVIHLRAQMDGLLFSLRTLSQILISYSENTSNESLDDLRNFAIQPISHIILTGTELTELDVAKHTRIILELAQSNVTQAVEPGDEDLEVETSTNSPIMARDDMVADGWTSVKPKSRSQSKKKRKNPEPQSEGKSSQTRTSQNRFLLLH